MAIFALLLSPADPPLLFAPIVGGAVLVVAGPAVLPGWLTVGVLVTTTISVLVLSSGGDWSPGVGDSVGWLGVGVVGFVGAGVVVSGGGSGVVFGGG